MFVTHSIPEAVFLSTRIVVMSPRPGRILEVIDIDLPADRTLDIRETPAFLDIAHGCAWRCAPGMASTNDAARRIGTAGARRSGPAARVPVAAVLAVIAIWYARRSGSMRRVDRPRLAPQPDWTAPS